MIFLCANLVPLQKHNMIFPLVFELVQKKALWPTEVYDSCNIF